MSMDIYAKPNSKVIFANPENGYAHDQEQCQRYLKVGEVYTVEKTEVSQSSTAVELLECPGQIFNSVMFEDFN